jgi:hypothetical protein
MRFHSMEGYISKEQESTGGKKTILEGETLDFLIPIRHPKNLGMVTMTFVRKSAFQNEVAR